MDQVPYRESDRERMLREGSGAPPGGFRGMPKLTESSPLSAAQSRLMEAVEILQKQFEGLEQKLVIVRNGSRGAGRVAPQRNEPNQATPTSQLVNFIDAVTDRVNILRAGMEVLTHELET